MASLLHVRTCFVLCLCHSYTCSVQPTPGFCNAVQVCCTAFNAQCESCKAGLTEKDYCAKAMNQAIDGCEAYATTAAPPASSSSINPTNGNTGGKCDAGNDDRVGFDGPSDMAVATNSKPMIMSPRDGWVLTDYAVSFRWQRLTHSTNPTFIISDYQLQVSTSKNFASTSLNIFHTAPSGANDGDG